MVENELLFADQFIEIETHRHEVLLQVIDLLLEGDEDTGIVILGYPTGDELHSKEGLPAARAAADQCRPAFGQTSACYVIKALDPGRNLLERKFS
jgi:hypothetical protein